MIRAPRWLGAWFALVFACASPGPSSEQASPASSGRERIQVLELYSGVTATIVAPERLDAGKPVELILYALPNGNTTAETMGHAPRDSARWRVDIQHIAAQTRALRARGIRGLDQAIVVYLEADTKSWPLWRSRLGYERANARIVGIVDQIRAAIGESSASVTLTGHSGGGSFMFGFMEGQDALPPWLDRIAFLDANYNFAPRHGETLTRWLRGDARRTLVVLAYDDREIMLDGKKVVSDSGGTWRATNRMINYLREPYRFVADTLGAFRRWRAPQIEILRHPNPANRILHTEMIGEMNGYMHALLVRRPSYMKPVLEPARAYAEWLHGEVTLPTAAPPRIPARRPGAMTGSAFIATIENLAREERQAAILRELFAGNIPSFLRALRSVEGSVTTGDSLTRTFEFDVMPDYLAIGSDTDFVRIPMMPWTAQAFCDAFGFALPTRKMVNDIWTAAPTHLDPRPLTQEREAPRTFLQHHRIIEDQLMAGNRASGTKDRFLAGHKKDVVVTNQLAGRMDRVAIYGWHYTTGKPIQPLYVGHVGWYVDYSHGIRPVGQSIRLDGRTVSIERILADSVLSGLLSDEGPITTMRYER